MSARQKALAEQEIRLSTTLAQHRHPDLVQFLSSFEDGIGYYQVFEFCDGGDLYQALHSRGAPFLESNIATQVLVPLLESLVFLHRMQIVHRDVKLENLMMADGRVKLGDFGLAVSLQEEQPKVRVGTIDYNAPEVNEKPSIAELEESGADSVTAYDEKVDIWAVGVVAYELLVGHAPFYMLDAADTKALIRDGNLPGFLGFLTDDCVNFLQEALRKDAKERPSALELLQHPWLEFHCEKGRLDEGDDKHTYRESQIMLSSPTDSQLSSTTPASPSMVSRVMTFASPNQSLSPRMGTWKIHTQVSDAKQAAAASDVSVLALVHRPSLLRSELSQELKATAEDVHPKAPGPGLEGFTNGGLIRTLSYVGTAPQLEILREEVAESVLGGPATVDFQAIGETPWEATQNSAVMVPSILRTTSWSAGKSRFA